MFGDRVLLSVVVVVVGATTASFPDGKAEGGTSWNTGGVAEDCLEVSLALVAAEVDEPVACLFMLLPNDDEIPC